MSALAAGPLVGNTSSAHDCLICLRCARIPPIRSDLRFPRPRRLSSLVLIRSVREQRLPVTEKPKEEEKEVKLVNGYNWNGNGSVPGLEVAERSANGNLDAYLEANGMENGNLVKYAGGSEAAVEEVDGATAEKKRKKRVEEIGKEDAWFKNDTVG